MQNAASTVLSQSKIPNCGWAFYKKHITSFWTPEEIDFSDDMKHLPNLPPDQLHFLSMVLSQFLCHQ
jgi:ribonucleotide reductase beta subunit family protein with ferritin-like domain